MTIKERIISELEKEGYLSDEAERKVDSSWWIIEMYFKCLQNFEIATKKSVVID